MKRVVFAFLTIALASAGVFLGYLAAPSPALHSDFYAPAVTDVGNGLLVKFRVSITPGQGRTLVNIQNAQYKEDAENAFLKAKANAEEILGVKLLFQDVILDVESIGSNVGGESAGAMFTIGIISAYTGRKIASDVVMSAGITNDGVLFAVDSIEEKIIAAKINGKKKFIVAEKQQVKNEDLIKDISIIRSSTVRDAVQQALT